MRAHTAAVSRALAARRRVGMHARVCCVVCMCGVTQRRTARAHASPLERRPTGRLSQLWRIPHALAFPLAFPLSLYLSTQTYRPPMRRPYRWDGDGYIAIHTRTHMHEPCDARVTTHDASRTLARCCSQVKTARRSSPAHWLAASCAALSARVYIFMNSCDVSAATPLIRVSRASYCEHTRYAQTPPTFAPAHARALVSESLTRAVSLSQMPSP